MTENIISNTGYIPPHDDTVKMKTGADKPLPLAEPEVKTTVNGWYTTEEAARELGVSKYTIVYYRRVWQAMGGKNEGGIDVGGGFYWRKFPQLGGAMMISAESILHNKWLRKQGKVKRGRQHLLTTVDV